MEERTKPELYHMVEAVLFASGEPISVTRLASACEAGEDAVLTALRRLAAEYAEQKSAAHSKVFCRCQGIRNRKLQHQVYPCLDCQSGTGKFVQNCRIAALHKVSAHNGNNAVCAAFPHLAQMIQMAIVQGIVFADNTTDFHVKSSKKMCGKCKIYRIRLRISANLLHFPQKGL